MLKNPNYVYGPQTVQVPSHLNFGEFILGKMWTYGDKIALLDAATENRITYSEIMQQAMNFAVSLTRIGVRKGDTIGIMSENLFEYWGAVIGTVCAGAVLTAISVGYVEREILHVLNISKPRYIICSPTIYKKHVKLFKSLKFIRIIVFGEEKNKEVLNYNDMTLAKNKLVTNIKYEEFTSVEVKGQTDTVFIVYSSGTTGLPKGVMLSHLNVIAAGALPASHDPSQATLSVLPWYHVMGLIGILARFSLGGTVTYLPKFEINTYMMSIEKYKITQLIVVPPILVAVTKHQSNYDLSSVKVIYSGAAPLHKDTIKAVHEKFRNVPMVFQGYGSSEVTLAVSRFSYSDVNLQKVGSVGKVIPNTIIKVVDIETNRPLGPNKPGEICAKGDLLMKGYVGLDNRLELDDEGFYKTGDIGYYDDDGYFFIVDRLKELIKYKGYQVPPAELEAVLLQHKSIKDAGVIGIEDESAGEVPLAFVVTQPDVKITEKEIQDFVAVRVSNPKHLRGGIRFVEQIPKLPSGKILRKELRKMIKNKSKL